MFSKSLIESSTTSASICDTLLSSIYHKRVHCLPLNSLFATHMSYGFSLKHFSINVSEYNVYHCRANSMHLYMECNTNIYNTFWIFSYLMFFLWSRFISHIISMNVTLSFNNFFILWHIRMQVCSRNVKSSYLSPFIWIDSKHDE